MKLYCIELAKFTKAELPLLVRQYNVPINAEELFRLKMSGYHQVFIDEETNKWLFYTLNNAKKDIKVADCIKNIIIDLKPISQKVINRESTAVNTNLVHLTTGLSLDEILKEYDKILEKIHQHGIDSITVGEQKFLNSYSNLSY